MPVGSFLDPGHLIGTFGLIGIMLILFAECGLLIGFFLPGDSLLFAAGFAAGGHVPKVHPHLWVVCVFASLVAIAGAQTGFTIGRTAGPALFDRPDSRLFKREYVAKAEEAVERYGVGRAIVLARFVPIVRTFATVMAGASRMNFRSYALFSVIGGVAWAAGITVLGYWLGGVQVVRDHIELFVLGVVVVSLVPIAVEYLRGRRRTNA